MWLAALGWMGLCLSKSNLFECYNNLKKNHLKEYRLAPLMTDPSLLTPPMKHNFSKHGKRQIFYTSKDWAKKKKLSKLNYQQNSIKCVWQQLWATHEDIKTWLFGFPKSW